MLSLKRANPSDQMIMWDGALFCWETANAPYAHDEDQPFVTTVASTHEPLSHGAWIRQRADSLSFEQGLPFVHARKALDKLREHGASVLDTGAIGDGRSDDTAALQEIADHFGASGGVWRLPPGIYRTTSEIILRCERPQRILGSGKRGVYPGIFDGKTSENIGVILPVHDGRSAIRFVGSKVGLGSVEIQSVAMATLETGAVPVAAFGWDTAETFLRDFTFADCSIHGFTSAFDLFNSGGANTQMGVFRARRCTINRNAWIARTLDDTHWNGFSFKDCEAGQNGYLPGQGGLSISGHSIEISGNCLEGMRDPVHLSGFHESIDIRSNYFEEVVGRAAISLENIRGPWEIGPNTFVSIDPQQLRHRALLTNCGPGRSAIPYHANGVQKTPPCPPDLPPKPSGLLATQDDTDGFLRCDLFDTGQNFTLEPDYHAIAKQRVNIAARETSPVTGAPMPVEQFSATKPGAVSLVYDLNGATGEWAVVSWLFKRVSGKAAGNPYVSFDVNGAMAAGSRDYVAYNFDTFWRPGEWTLLTCAVRLQTPMTSLLLRLFPFGIDPEPGLMARFLRPVVYTVDASEKIVPYVDHELACSTIAPPAAGDWRQGDRVANAAPTQAGQGTFLCIRSGMPGSWVLS